MKVSFSGRRAKISARRKRVDGTLRRISVLRLISFSTIPGTILGFYVHGTSLTFALPVVLVTIIAFLRILSVYQSWENYRSRLKSYEAFLTREQSRNLKKTKELFRSIPVSDSDRRSHSFAEDLNLFEKDGLFVLLDTTSTVRGEELFLENFLRKTWESSETILDRQARVQSYCQSPYFSYRFLRTASENWEFFLGKKWNTIGWKRTEFAFFQKRRLLEKTFPVLSILGLLAILGSLLFQAPFGAPFFILNTILFILYRSDSLHEFSRAEEIQSRQTETLRLLLLISRTKKSADSGSIRKAFQSVQSSFSSIWTSPLPHFIANGLFLYDLWKMRKTRNWIAEHGKDLTHWIEELEEVDSLLPWIHLRFHNPSWVFPVIQNLSETPGHREIRGEDLAHPLLDPQSAVSNPMEKLTIGGVLLITGSNMAGKTTYMRTIGTNVLMGLCGGPVNASYMTLPPLEITCSVKNQDSLTEGISLFYAEARRLAEIFRSMESNPDKTYLVLLDEILKGTNTRERYLASELILKKLQGKNAFTLCTTHDLDLAKIPGLDLKHFTETIEGNNMSFDFKIRPGVVQTTNALFILQKEGVV